MSLQLEIYSEEEELAVADVIVPGLSTSTCCSCCAIAEY